MYASVCGLPAANGERGEENGYEFRLAAELEEDEGSPKGRASVSFHVSSSSSHHRLLHFILKKNIILTLEIFELRQAARCMLNRCGNHSESKIHYVLHTDAPDYGLKSSVLCTFNSKMDLTVFQLVYFWRHFLNFAKLMIFTWAYTTLHATLFQSVFHTRDGTNRSDIDVIYSSSFCSLGWMRSTAS